ncbi:hypothetical protein CDD80_1986 [Ophiocordyceps camponoti-rufipedis]|uniref:AMMECR1 domain-containing protein n=1 Tax=Ophiocordyceps camponoti-rufipedis TaxID=2004952 RepID=A0A2C5Z7Y8_9HYPO|nr:hypothetical protein CDD80_1986 [Ophiocordyceps camponoti-rufipedis]
MASAEHCLLCFDALEAHLQDRKPLPLDRIQSSWAAFSASASPSTLKDPALRRVAATSSSSSSSQLSTASSSSSASPALASTPATSTSSLPLTPSPPPTSTPLFVTWNTVSDGDVCLRGCIGTFESQPLAVGIPEYAVTSAVHDTRFQPICSAEVPSLQAAVTLLTDFEEARDMHDWQIGVHGIRLSFSDRGRRYGSTYLPDVAVDQGWSKDETIYNLVRKAGWMGSRSRWKDLDLDVTRYQGKKCVMDYSEYKGWRDWMAATK